jgi:ribokinase
MQMSSVLVIGDALIDNQYFVQTVPKKGQDEKIVDYSKSMGGSASNAAIALSRCGVQTYFCGSVGKDTDGQAFIDNFEKNNVDTSLIQQKGKTGFTVTMIDDSGERTMLSYRDASSKEMQVTSALALRIKKVSVVLISGYMLLEPKQAAFAIAVSVAVRENGGKVALDPSPIIEKVDKKVLKQVLELTDVLLPNEDEFNIITKKAGEVDVPCIAVKQGDKGARLIHDVAEYIQPAKQVEAVDTTGAGDAFNAAFIASMINEDPPQTWLKKGVEYAASVVGKKGAV